MARAFLLLKYFSFLLLITSCRSTRNLVYFSDLNTPTEEKITLDNTSIARIQTDDLLSISVSTLNPESNALFNGGAMPKLGGSLAGGGAEGGGAAPSSSAGGGSEYLVDKNGMINFPVLGLVKVAGLTKEELTEKMTKEIAKSVKNPIINIRYLNFRITVIGEVNNPSTFIVPTEKINIMQALALAGDMSVFGKRENVLIIREKNGIRNTVRLDLNNKATMTSPYYYLQQNDIVYIEPDEARQDQTNISRTNTQFTVSIIISALSVVTLLVTTLINLNQ